MKIATFNVNGINGRLAVLLRWLEEARPDVVCLQELKAPDARFPIRAIEQAGYGAVWHGQKSWNGVAILARGREPIETRRGLPGDPEDEQARYIEAAVEGLLIGCLYLPNGNPAPGAKFDAKLRWFTRLTAHAAELRALDVPVILAGDYNVMPTDRDVYKPERWVDDALFRPEVRAAFHAHRTGLDRRAARAAPRCAPLHLLGLSSERLRTRCRAAARPSPAEPHADAATRGRRGRPRRARLGEGERPRPGLDRAYPHAPGAAARRRKSAG
ncbi:exodeoxyribonuclease III [Ancylobacter rudongensis]|uniref:Exodeoxyribonuclease III n=1 Tax=Ancylobacter rudongensis TaxID=177413 RepID=A0A1G4ULC5_9HYPH|nr:exodeoxyribonuclease III [Ancylobacter rudongensis]